MHRATRKGPQYIRGSAASFFALLFVPLFGPLFAHSLVPQRPPRHTVPTNPAPDIELTREYLQYLRETMGSAVADLTSFDEVYVETDWSRHAELPAVEAANRINAYDNFLRMQQEALGKEQDRAPVTLNDDRSPHTAHRTPLTAH
jgi:hypothetical protein